MPDNNSWRVQKEAEALAAQNRRKAAAQEERERRKAVAELSKSPQYRSFKTEEEAKRAEYLVEQLLQEQAVPRTPLASTMDPAPLGATTPFTTAFGGGVSLAPVLQMLQDIAAKLEALRTMMTEIKENVQRPVVGP